MVLDGRLTLTGSYGFFMRSGGNYENLVAIQSPAVAAAYERYIGALSATYRGTTRPA